jgi:NADPH-dependent glutamate synthase beta subunit-like oxidoreductase
MSDAHDPLDTTVPRRDFLRIAGLGTGALLAGGLPSTAAAESLASLDAPQVIAGKARASMHVIVVGAGSWGAFTSLELRKAGHKVTLIDQYGAANSRATSGDETRANAKVIAAAPEMLASLIACVEWLGAIVPAESLNEYDRHVLRTAAEVIEKATGGAWKGE